MDKTKKVIGEVMSKSGQHDTTVTQETAPAVEQKVVKPTSHEEISTAVEQEVHQDHYHRTVQPLEATEVLPEQHKHRVAGTVNREFDHRDQAATERAIRAESGKLRDTRTVEETRHTQSRAPVVQGEHVHHHIHETVQPVIQKEVIQPEVIHTAVPVHEVHHNPAQIHSTTSREPVSIDEYKRSGGTLSGSSPDEMRGTTTTATKKFEGTPDSIRSGDKIGISGMSGATTTTSSSTTSGSGTGSGTGSGGLSGLASSMMGSSSGDTTTTSKGLSTSNTSSSTKKPSLMDRLNPYKDSSKD